jgi:release factor glutamine methyltransferase
VLVARLRTAGCVFAEDEARILLDSAASATELEAMIAAREEGRPIEHIVGWAEFCGLRVRTAPGVFVPRRRTEFLAAQAIRVTGPGGRVVDLCCGTGAVGLAVASAVANVELYAVDLDPAAVACAQVNLAPVGGAVHEGDVFAALPDGLRGSFDVIVANAPYVPSDAIALMPVEARLFEHRIALDGGADGLDVHRRIAACAPDWLRSSGALLIETSEGQADATATAMADAGFAIRLARDSDRDATVVVGRVRRRNR